MQILFRQDDGQAIRLEFADRLCHLFDDKPIRPIKLFLFGWKGLRRRMPASRIVEAVDLF